MKFNVLNKVNVGNIPPKHKDTPVINREREMSSITFAHMPKCRVLAGKFGVYMPNCIILAVKGGVNTSHCIVLEVECRV